MKSILFAGLLAFAVWPLFAQTASPSPSKGGEKSATPVPTQNSKPNTQNSTRAVVVGISDYQDAGIPDLRFADRDAEAFANFLRSPGGGSLSSENLRVLINQAATAGQVIAALTWLLEESKPGDQAIIYFSGHGDVEAKLLNQLGFLLLWDSPAHVYLSGALPVDMLRQVVSTLSIEMKTKVFVVVDACRAGKLAGNTVIGTQLTGSQLAQQFSQEQKVLSCQPNEFSIEGEQWGGGRGAFSYHLCNGLYGMADGDHDGQVSLFEVGRYLEDRVPREVSPLSQMPLTVGDKSSVLFSIDGPTLAVLEKQGVPPVSIARVEQRGMLQEVLAKADTSARFWYAGFVRALRSNLFFEPAGDCAEYFFQRLMETESIAALRPMLKRNYAAALQDDAQQAMNIWLKADVQQLLCIGKSLRLEPIPRQLGRAAELLGEGHYMYRSLHARRLLFEGIMQMKHSNPDERLGRECLSLFRQSLELEDQSPLPWHRMSQVYAGNLRMPDSAFACARQARYLAPNWVLPYADLGYTFSHLGKLDLAKQALEEAEDVDSQHPYVINRWADWFNKHPGKANQEMALSLFVKYRKSGGPLYPCWFNDFGIVLQNLGRYSECEAKYKEVIALDSTKASSWNNLGGMYSLTRRYTEAEQVINKSMALDSTYAYAWNNLGDLYYQTGHYTEAEPVLRKAIALDSTLAVAWCNLGNLYNKTGRYAEAELVIKKAIALDSINVTAWNNLGGLYYQTGRYAEAEPVIKKAIALDSTYITAWNNLGGLYYQTGRYSEAEPVLKKAIALDSTYVDAWNSLGILYSQTRRYSEAEPVLQNVIALDSTYVNAWNSLGSLYYQTRRYADAEPFFLKSIALDSINVYAWNSLGASYNQIGRYAEAEPVLKKAIALDSTYITAWQNLGELYSQTRRYPEEEKALKKIIALDSTNVYGWNNLGYFYNKTRRYAEAEPVFKKAIALDSMLANPRKHLGTVCFKTNRPELARQNFLKAIALNPNYAGAMLGMAYLSAEALAKADAPASAKDSAGKEALDYVEQAIGKGSTFEQLELDEDLAPLRALPQWKELMKKHFPDKVKD